MNTERNREDCDRQRDELLRLACGDRNTPTQTLQAHLSACVTCREMLEATHRLTGELRVALEPEPLSESLQARILAELDEVAPHVSWAPARMRLAVAGAAVAACILITIMLPRGFSPAIGTPGAIASGDITLSEDDAAAIAAAYAVLRWDDPVEYALEALAKRANDVAQSVERKPEGRNRLPWSTQDDWDVPVTTSESSYRVPAPAVCAGGTAGAGDA